jgi:hypothetical protein
MNKFFSQISHISTQIDPVIRNYMVMNIHPTITLSKLNTPLIIYWLQKNLHSNNVREHQLSILFHIRIFALIFPLWEVKFYWCFQYFSPIFRNKKCHKLIDAKKDINDFLLYFNPFFVNEKLKKCSIFNFNFCSLWQLSQIIGLGQS